MNAALPPDRDFDQRFASQLLDTLCTKILIQVQSNLTVRASSKLMSALFELPPLSLKIIELAIHDDPNSSVLIGDRLIPAREVDDAKPRMAETNAVVS